MSDDLVRVDGLTVGYRPHLPAAVRDVSLRVADGEFHGLVGESGSGKSTIARALLGLTDNGAAIRSGSVRIAGVEAAALRGRALRRLRGGTVGYVGQNPFGALHPTLRIGRQFELIRRAHANSFDAKEGRHRAAEMLEQFGLAEPESILGGYRHQLSGGMAQRVVIAMALYLEPRLLIADEPTTGLDLTVQKQILDLLEDRARTRGVGLLFITHDLGVVTQYCDRVSVLYGGQVMETGPVDRVFVAPRHPYTQALLDSVPEPGRAPVPLASGHPVVDAGCPFRGRCPAARAECASAPPPVEFGAGWIANCHAVAEVST